ncbi:OmpW/AlkL family protein [Rhizobium sp. BK377]|uniref:OmpW/AlkL family protein n=1 Tax=Rhizobium sp. BK377 TaxID=2587058 RepID=UPI00161D18F3|nr:OmpW family protein [Rhizobium sp. BK377]MBB3463663.1 outer membrane protein [Rhizobium sp. BK377]
MKHHPLRLKGIFAAIVFASFGHAALSADLAPSAGSPMATQSPWQVRLRALGVITRDNGSVDGISESGLSYSDTVIPEADISYFFTDNISAELILGTTYANVRGEGSIAGLGEIGKTWLLPPTLTLQYHFTDFGAFQPYLGAGVNYTVFYNQSGKSADSLDVKNTFGVALQAGFDYMFDEHWGANMDVKKIFLRPDFDATVGGADVSGKAKLDPWLIGAGITYRF